MKSPPPTLMDLCLDALTRQPQQERKLQESCGSFWCAAAMGDEPKVLAPLPLPASVKAAALGKLRTAGRLSDEALILLLDSTLVSLDLSSCRAVSGDSLAYVPALCPDLGALDLSWCCQLRASDVEDLASASLRALSLRGCFRLAPTAVAALLARLPALSALRLPTLSDEADGGSLVLGQLAAAAGGERLRVLEFHGLHLSAPELEARLPPACRHLRVLCLRDVPCLDDGHVATLLEHSARLEHLDLSGADAARLTGSFLTSAAVRSPTLVALRADGKQLGAGRPGIGHDGLDLDDVASRAAAAARGALGRLATLAVESLALERLARPRAPPANDGARFPALRRLSLCGGTPCMRADFVRDALSACPQLASLEVGGRRGGRLALADDEAAAFFASGARLAALAELTLQCCALSVDLAAALSEYTPSLLCLRCVGCAGLTAGFAAGLRALPQLACLQTLGCSGCTDEELAMIASVLPEAVRLETVEARGLASGGGVATAAWRSVARAAVQRRAWVAEAVVEDAATAALWEDLGAGGRTSPMS